MSPMHATHLSQLEGHRRFLIIAHHVDSDGPFVFQLLEQAQHGGRIAHVHTVHALQYIPVLNTDLFVKTSRGNIVHTISAGSPVDQVRNNPGLSKQFRQICHGRFNFTPVNHFSQRPPGCRNNRRASWQKHRAGLGVRQGAVSRVR